MILVEKKGVLCCFFIGTSDEHISTVESLQSLQPDGAVLVTTPQVNGNYCGPLWFSPSEMLARMLSTGKHTFLNRVFWFILEYFLLSSILASTQLSNSCESKKVETTTSYKQEIN